MSITATRTNDGLIYARCPKKGCGATLRITAKSDRSRVTCGHCRHRFILEVMGIHDISAGTTDLDFTNDARPSPRRRKYRRRSSSMGLIVAVGVGAILLGGCIAAGVYAMQQEKPQDEPVTPVVNKKGIDESVAATTPTIAQAATTPKKPFVRKTKRADAVALRITAETQKTKPDLKPAQRKPSQEEIFTRVKNSTALIEESGKGWGTGFVIRPNIVMTNAHVVSGMDLDEMRVSFVSLDDTAPPKLKATLLYFDTRRDLAILSVKTDRAPLEMVASGTQLSEMDVAVIGNPRGDAGQAQINKVTTGKLSAPIRRDAGWTYYELSAEAFFGNSGGPVIEAKTGKLVGVMQSILGDGKNKSYCIPYGEATRALEQLPDEKQYASATKVALARYALESIASRLPEMESKAEIAMDAQCLRLLGKSAGLEFLFKLPNGSTVLLSDYLEGLKTLYKELSPATTKAMKIIERSSSEIPRSLRSAASVRLETCWRMYDLANATTNTLAGFKKAIEERKTASDRAVANFEKEYEKYLDRIDAKD